MKLYCPISLKNFITGLQHSWKKDVIHITLHNLLTSKQIKEYDYSLSLFRQSIRQYEETHGIPPEESKAEIPFFRENINLFVGPEMHLYTVQLYETPEIGIQEGADLILTFDYGKLGEHCIFGNLFLLKCKYDKDASLSFFEKQMEKEYEHFFYHEGYTGFTPESRFFSLLCDACLEIREPQFAGQKEWNMATLVMPEDVNYFFSDGQLTSNITTAIPLELIEKIHMPSFKERKDDYTALAGLLKQKGLKPKICLEGFE